MTPPGLGGREETTKNEEECNKEAVATYLTRGRLPTATADHPCLRALASLPSSAICYLLWDTYEFKIWIMTEGQMSDLQLRRKQMLPLHNVTHIYMLGEDLALICFIHQQPHDCLCAGCHRRFWHRRGVADDKDRLSSSLSEN